VQNFKLIFRYKEDRAALLDFGLGFFLDSYMENSKLRPNARQSFLKQLRNLKEVK
jgi:hypothetical protein